MITFFKTNDGNIIATESAKQLSREETEKLSWLYGEAEALKEFFREAGQAVDTTHLTDSVTMLTKEGFEVRHEVFLHDAPAPEPEVLRNTTSRKDWHFHLRRLNISIRWKANSEDR